MILQVIGIVTVFCGGISLGIIFEKYLDETIDKKLNKRIKRYKEMMNDYRDAAEIGRSYESPDTGAVAEYEQSFGQHSYDDVRNNPSNYYMAGKLGNV